MYLGEIKKLTNHFMLKEKREVNTKKNQNTGHTIRPNQKIRESEFETTFLLVSCKKTDQIGIKEILHSKIKFSQYSLSLMLFQICMNL